MGKKKKDQKRSKNKSRGNGGSTIKCKKCGFLNSKKKAKNTRGRPATCKSCGKPI
ncbi:hypothetical protein K9M79_05650 [Candidatus Woesearchaeota archaeon]|nr:hypothetical protein [Candidatus Woesearchaeota archaeon]